MSEVKKALRIRNNRDIKRKNSPLIQTKDGVIVDTGKLKTISGMLKPINIEK